MLEVLQTTLLSTGVVAAAEIGDKTMLLAVFWLRAPQTLDNHPWDFCCHLPKPCDCRRFGATLANFISADLLRWILIVSFIAMGIWILIPDKIDEGGNNDRLRRFGVFGTTVILFFIAEVGDKTQVATVALAARYPAEAFWVVCGTTLGLMIADAPAVFIGNKLAEKISMKLMRQIAAAVFFILAVVAYLEA